MAVTLSRAYGGLASGSIFVGPADTENALVAQGYATARTPASNVTGQFGNLSGAIAGNVVPYYNALNGNPAVPQGPRRLPNTPINGFASLGTSAVHVAGTLYVSEIYVPHVAQWTGISILNGVTVGTDNLIGALYASDGTFIASSALAGTLSAGANAFQDLAFTSAVLLYPGRYFGVLQANGAIATTRRIAATMGGNVMAGTVAGTFGTLPAAITAPTASTADAGPIFQLYV